MSEELQAFEDGEKAKDLSGFTRINTQELAPVTSLLLFIFGFQVISHQRLTIPNIISQIVNHIFSSQWNQCNGMTWSKTIGKQLG